MRLLKIWRKPDEKKGTVKSYTDQLTDVQNAIHEIETKGAETEIEVNGNRRRVKRGDLGMLYKREAYLLRLVERETRQGPTYVVPC
jgi:hypothetical protein